MFETKSLSLNLNIPKPKIALKFGSFVKFEQLDGKTPTGDEEGSFYGVLDDEAGLEDAVDFFSLPTPDVMKTFIGKPLQVNTPTMEENRFAEETALNIQHRSQDMDLASFLPVPEQRSSGDSLTTPIVDLNNTRPALGGHLFGLAPTETNTPQPCSSPSLHSGLNFHTTASSTIQTTHEMLSPSVFDDSCYDDTSSMLSASTSSFAAPLSYSVPSSTSFSSPSNYTELQVPRVNFNAAAPSYSSQELPTVLDHMYAHGGGFSPRSYPSAPSPAPSTSSQASTIDNKDALHKMIREQAAAASGSRKRKSSNDSSETGSSKKGRMTKKQQFLELQSKETRLTLENEELKTKVTNMTAACKRLKEMLMRSMKHSS